MVPKPLLSSLACLACFSSGLESRPAADATVYLTVAQAANVYRAKQVAGSMFRSAQVEVSWANGKPKPAPTGITVLVQPAVDTPESLRPGALAVSYPYAGLTKGITVYYDRVQRLAAESNVPEPMLLAHVLVHEITHVLVRLERHSDAGVMKATWSRADYGAMASHTLPFSAEDIEWIHRALHREDQ
jgi:hypothetical protein